jgi:hypothetical protein
LPCSRDLLLIGSGLGVWQVDLAKS